MVILSKKRTFIAIVALVFICSLLALALTIIIDNRRSFQLFQHAIDSSKSDDPVTVTTEFAQYPAGIKCINAIWVNNSESSIMISLFYSLEKLDGADWIHIYSPGAVSFQGHGAASGESHEDMYPFSDSLAKGYYRIALSYYEIPGTDFIGCKDVFAYFAVK